MCLRIVVLLVRDCWFRPTSLLQAIVCSLQAFNIHQLDPYSDFGKEFYLLRAKAPSQISFPPFCLSRFQTRISQENGLKSAITPGQLVRVPGGCT